MAEPAGHNPLPASIAFGSVGRQVFCSFGSKTCWPPSDIQRHLTAVQGATMSFVMPI